MIGHFPSSDEWFGTTQLGSLEAFVHDSSGDVNDLNATFVDHGVIAWDVLTGAARVVLPPDPNVRTRWDLHVAPGGTTVASGRSPGDSLAYDVLGSNGATHTFETDINLDAISSRYGLGYGQVFDPDLNRVLERHVLVDLSDGSQRLIPAKADALLEICEGCLQYAVGPSWVVDDHHFLLVRSKLWMLDGADNTVTAVFDLAGHGLHPFEIVSPLLSQDWFLVTASAYSEPVDLQALNLNDGTLIELGVAR